MNLKEAEEFYRQYNGMEFHMFREEPELYKEFNALDISDEIRRKWDDELINGILDSLWNDRTRVWSRHELLIEIMRRTKDRNHVERLLDEMEKMAELDKQSRILIIENMAGRSASLKGGCMLVFQTLKDGRRMSDIMNRIMNFDCSEEDNTDKMGWTDVPGRYDRAVSAYKDAYQKWSREAG